MVEANMHIFNVNNVLYKEHWKLACITLISICYLPKLFELPFLYDVYVSLHRVSARGFTETDVKHFESSALSTITNIAEKDCLL